MKHKNVKQTPTKVYGHRLLLLIAITVTLCLWTAPVSATPASDAATLAVSINSYTGETTGNLSAAASGATVTVTGTATINNGSFPEINIKEGVTLDWNASLTTNNTSNYSEFRPTGKGTFRLLSNGSLTYAGPSGYNVGALNPQCSTTVIDGGTISCSTASAIYLYGNYGDRTVTIKSGTVTGNNNGAINISIPDGETTYINMEGGTLNYTNSGGIAKGVIYASRGTVNIVIKGGVIQDPSGEANCSVWYNNYQDTYIASGNILYLNGTSDGTNPPSIGSYKSNADLYYIGTVKVPLTYGLKDSQIHDLSVMETQNTVDSSAYTYDAATPYAGTVSAIFHDALNMSGAAVTATAGTVAANHQSISFSGTFKNDAVTATVSGAKFGSLTLPNFTTAPFGINIIPPSYDINIIGGEADFASAISGQTVTVTANAANDSHRFKEWSISPSVTFVNGTGKTDATAKFVMPAQGVTVTAIYEDYYTVSVTQGTANLNAATAGNTVIITADDAPSGQRFKEWNISPSVSFVNSTSKTDATAKFTMPSAAVTAIAVYEPIPVHQAYINGYQNGTFKPNAAITRGEAAQLLYNLTGATAAGTASFGDVPSDKWYHNAVTYLAERGIINGYSDGTFKPNASITRAEFTTLIVRYQNITAAGTPTFIDITANHWAKGYIAAAQNAGLIGGYQDGSFQPENKITRAETVTILNRALGRSDKNADYSDLTMPFSDVPANHWAYREIIEAAVTHDFTVHE